MDRDDDIFADALELPPAERAAFLDKVCGHDPIRRTRIEALLLGHQAAESFLEQPLAPRPEPVPAEGAGDQVGPYTLLRRIGEGGCGVVWLAEQTKPLRRLVALKVIKLGMDTRNVIARFDAERQTLALMSHPDIARVYDAGATKTGRPYFVMEYVEGLPVTKFCDEHRIPMSARLDLFARICLAVQHAHQKGIVHRDLKPSNILVTLRDGQPVPKIIDFGIAKATAGRLGETTLFTELGQFLGTPAYMSPEQAEQRDADLDTRSDVYSLGVLLYELLTGRPPYDPQELVRAGVLEIRRIIREVEPPRPSTAISTLTAADRDTVARLRGAPSPRLTAALRGDLDWIVMRCLEKDRDRRYGTAAALAEDVRRHLRQEPVEARPPHAFYRWGKFVARNRLACASAAALTLSLVAGTVVSTLQAIRASRAEQVAAAERDAARAAQQAETLARADAQRRQEQAEDLLTFMLGDFRTELAKIGRLNLLDAVGAKALAYFTALDPRDLTDAALTRQAKALTQIGEVRMEQARFPEAAEAFGAALARTTALTKRYPANGDMLYERAQAEFWLGYVARRRGDRSTQRDWLVRYRDSAAALVTVEGPTRRAQLELASGHHNLAVLDVDAGDLGPAETGFQAEQAALAPQIAATPADPELLARQADAASWLGTIAERDGRYAEAADRFATMAGRYEELTRLEPENRLWRFERAQSLTFLGNIRALIGRGPDAAAHYAAADVLLAELVTHDPANKRWLSTRLRLNLFQAALDLATPGPSLAKVSAARQRLEALTATEPNSVNFARLTVMAWTLEARLLFASDRLAEAVDAITRARQLAEPLGGNPSADIWTRHLVAQALITEGRLALARGQPPSADLWDRVRTVLGPEVVNSRDWRLLEPATLANVLGGTPEAAAPLINRLKNFGYRPIDPLNAATLGLAE